MRLGKSTPDGECEEILWEGLIIMRDTFIVGAKLLGVYLVYWLLFNLLSLLAVVVMAIWESRLAVLTIFSILAYLFSIAVLIIFSYILLFKTEWLSNIVGLRDDRSHALEFSMDAVLRAGIILIGVYIFSTRIGGLVKVLYNLLAVENVGGDIAASQPAGLRFSRDLITPGVTVAFSLLLMFGSKYLVKMIDRTED
ncbi:MAG: hypothetical protein P8Y66_09065 [Nitrospirota bacterium]